MPEFSHQFPVDTSQLAHIREFVREHARKLGFPEEELGKIELAVDEACANVIEHAYPGKAQGDGRLHLCLKLDYQKLTVVITDHGETFDPNQIKDPDMQEYLAEYRVGGLGVYLMRRFMDQVDYDIQPGVKNEVRMVKYLMPEGMQ